MKVLASVAAVILVLFLLAWVLLGFFGIVKPVPDPATTLCLLAIACCLVPPLPKVP